MQDMPADLGTYYRRAGILYRWSSFTLGAGKRPRFGTGMEQLSLVISVVVTAAAELSQVASVWTAHQGHKTVRISAQTRRMLNEGPACGGLRKSSLPVERKY